MYSGILVLGLIALMDSLCIADGHFTPVLETTETELKTWAKPPNKGVVKDMVLDRMLTAMDAHYNPCDNFYQFACGNYEKVAPPMSAKSMQPLIETAIQTQRALFFMLTRPRRSYSSSRIEKIVMDFYDSCKNVHSQAASTEDIMESFGSWPAIDPYWRESEFDWMTAMADVFQYENKSIIELGFGFGDNGRSEFEVFGLLLNVSLIENKPVETVDTLVRSYKKLFTNSRVSSHYIGGMAQRVHALSLQLHNILHSALKSFRSTRLGVPIYDVQRQVPSCDLGRLVSVITGQEVDTSKSITVPSVQYLEDVCRLMYNTNKQDIADYFFIQLYSKVKEEVDEVKEIEKLHNTCFKKSISFVSPLLSKLYIDEYITPEVIENLANMTDTLHKFAVEMMRTQTSWLDERTRLRAAKKMEVPIMLLVAPEYMRSEQKLLERFADVSINPTDYFHNLKQLKRHKFVNIYRMHGKSRHFYEIDPLALNPAFAKYARSMMMIQATAHQLPLFHHYAPSFLNFGAMMAIIGHELMHNFDAETILRDENGQETEWMSPNLAIPYAFRSECFYTQFQNYKLANTDVHVGGALTLSENVADNDGLKIAFRFYKKWMAENLDIVRQEEIDYAPLQLTHEQLFFLCYGQMWCDIQTTESLIDQIATDVHSPNMFRVIGGVSNLEEFAKAYQCPPHMKMNPSEKYSYFFD